VAGGPFLAYLLNFLARQGVAELVLSVGYLAQNVVDVLGDGRRYGVNIQYAVEETPLGTGGAVRFASQHLHIPDKPFFVLNGDTLLDCDLQRLARLVKKHSVLAGIVLRHVPDVSRYGAVVMGDNGLVTAFDEKTLHGPGFISGGVYLLTPPVLEMFPEGESAIERDLFPLLAVQREMAGQKTHGFFLDIGLPQTYIEAQTALPEWKKQAEARRPFVLLDRDGTLIEEKNYLHDPNEVVLLPGVIEGLSLLQKAGFGLVVVTNQSGIGRGYYDEQSMHKVNGRMVALLREQGIVLDGIFFCPHAPDAGCACRKPAPGMAMQAARELAFSLDSACVIGDKMSDIDMALGVGADAILVRTGYGREEEKQVSSRAEYVADNLLDAAQWLVLVRKDMCAGSHINVGTRSIEKSAHLTL
jgi:histidinol-phosphate phosphatase family protein